MEPALNAKKMQNGTGTKCRKMEERMNITELTVHELQEKIKNKELTITQINEAYINRIQEKGQRNLSFFLYLVCAIMEKDILDITPEV